MDDSKKNIYISFFYINHTFLLVGVTSSALLDRCKPSVLLGVLINKSLELPSKDWTENQNKKYKINKQKL